MDYCHDFASSVWKQSESDRLLYAGLIIGLTQETRGDIGSVIEDLQVVLQQHRAMLSSKRQDILACDATFKKHGTTTMGRLREKRLSSDTEKARMIKASSNRQKTHQACLLCKTNTFLESFHKSRHMYGQY
jgi:hypothetical protein